MTIRVLSLYEGFFAGGARILHTDVVAGLHERGDQQHSVLSIASEIVRERTVQPIHRDPRHARLTRAGVEVRTLGRTGGGDPPAPSTFTDAHLRIAAAAVAQADVILSLKEQPLGLLLALRDRGLLPEIPVAVCLHRSDPTHSGDALGWLAEASDPRIVTATISCALSTSDAYLPAAPGALRYVIANGVDTARFRPGTPAQTDATRSELGIPAGAPVVVFAARFDAMKDPGLFLRSVAAHAERRPGTHYLLCGAGMVPENAQLAALVGDAGIRPGTAVHLLGVRDDMPALYQVADVVALTSAFGEASPLCLVEGAACGATPVTTGIGDAPRIVDGIGIVTSHDPHQIASTWEHVLDERDAFRGRALAARPRLGRDRMIAEYRSTLNLLLQREQVAA